MWDFVQRMNQGPCVCVYIHIYIYIYTHIYIYKFDLFFLSYKTTSKIKNKKHTTVSSVIAKIVWRQPLVYICPAQPGVPREKAALAVGPHCLLQLRLEFPASPPAPPMSTPQTNVPFCAAPFFIVASLSSPEGQGELRSWGTPPSCPLPCNSSCRHFGKNGGCLAQFLVGS